jgi:PAS domain-containing protein
MTSSLLMAGVIGATSVAAALVALLLLSALQARRDDRPRLADLPMAIEPAVFLFDDRELVDATPPGLRLLAQMPGGSDWDRLIAYLNRHFPGTETQLGTLAVRGQIDLRADRHPGLRLHAEHLGELSRITISDLEAEGQGVIVDALSQRALEEELHNLRSVAVSEPHPAWHQDAGGKIDWANGAYVSALAEQRGVPVNHLGWPFAPLFDMAEMDGRTSARLRMLPVDQRPNAWFDIVARPNEGGTHYFAVPADAAVRAESSLREFIQTLGKTFAHLPIGLAVFDRQRQLALFNPALMDLTGLGAEFLTARPTLFTILDKLREMRMIPEPKNYRGWRQQMADLERAAASGLHQETWTLPTGQTYRVTGRPQPDGGVAFLFEDISTEMSLTRRFRAEIERGQEIFDKIDEAIAVFSPAGMLLQSNAAYARLWGSDPGATLRKVAIRDCVQVWQAQTLPNPAWNQISGFVAQMGARQDWSASSVRLDGQNLRCRVVPMSGGATLIGFSAVDAVPPAVRRQLKIRRATLLSEVEATEDA